VPTPGLRASGWNDEKSQGLSQGSLATPLHRGPMTAMPSGISGSECQLVYA
jgi:hypothetical protein